jgi:hypothetical protein
MPAKEIRDTHRSQFTSAAASGLQPKASGSIIITAKAGNYGETGVTESGFGQPKSGGVRACIAAVSMADRLMRHILIPARARLVAAGLQPAALLGEPELLLSPLRPIIRFVQERCHTKPPEPHHMRQRLSEGFMALR